MASFKYRLGLSELTSKKDRLLNCLLAEFVGIFLLNFFGVASCANPDKTLISLAFGLVVFMGVMSIGHISGGHLNPAVTCGMLAAGNISLVRALLYILIQCCGAVAGTAALYALLPDQFANIGHTQLADGVLPAQGLGIEFFLGFLLVFCVFGVCDENKPDHRFIAPLTIGLTVALGHLGAISLTGASMNPARSFGTALVQSVWTNHWLYWAGPISGGVTASLFYSMAFAAPEPEVETVSGKYRTTATEKEMVRLDNCA